MTTKDKNKNDIGRVRDDVYIGSRAMRPIERDSISSECYDGDGNRLPGTWRGVYGIGNRRGLDSNAERIA